MSTGIQWTDETPMVDRGGARVRIYRRTRTDRPGTQLRRSMAGQGKQWCRGCRDWLPAADVSRQGVCAAHANAEYRRNYASEAGVAIRARVAARKRGTDVLPAIAREMLMERFGGLCAFCSEPATTFDHLHPIARGGRTEPGNMVPACRPCNSSKKSRRLFEWLNEQRRGVEHPALMDVISLGVWCDFDEFPAAA